MSWAHPDAQFARAGGKRHKGHRCAKWTDAQTQEEKAQQRITDTSTSWPTGTRNMDIFVSLCEATANSARMKHGSSHHLTLKTSDAANRKKNRLYPVVQQPDKAHGNRMSSQLFSSPRGQQNIPLEEVHQQQLFTSCNLIRQETHLQELCLAN